MPEYVYWLSIFITHRFTNGNSATIGATKKPRQYLTVTWCSCYFHSFDCFNPPVWTSRWRCRRAFFTSLRRGIRRCCSIRFSDLQDLASLMDRIWNLSPSPNSRSTWSQSSNRWRLLNSAVRVGWVEDALQVEKNHDCRATVGVARFK